jgi:hypothetical protein
MRSGTREGRRQTFQPAARVESPVTKHANWKRRWDMYIGGGVLALILIILLLIWLF